MKKLEKFSCLFYFIIIIFLYLKYYFPDSWMKTLMYYKDWFKQQENFKADNSKKLNREESKLGDLPLDGSFRKIILD